MENRYQGYVNPLTGKRFRVVGAPIVKKDARALVTGKPVYTDDLAPKDCLIVKVLRSPHAHALVEEIDCKVAGKIPGIECILTWKDVPQKRFTMAGQTFPEPSPYDRLILDRRLRFVGDAVAIIAGTNEAAVDHAMRLIRVKYKVLEPVLDMHEAKDSQILVHPEEDWKALCPVGADNSRNLCASGVEAEGDLEAAFAGCAHVVERVYHTKANQQAMMETFRAFTYMDVYGRLNVVASTQIAFHVRRVLAHALDVPKSKIRVIKPRIGGGFGAKQTVTAEVYPAIVTMKTGKPAKMVYSRYESQIASSPRHEMEVRVKVGCDRHGILQAMDVYTLSNTGAYGEHGPTTVGLSGHKSIPLYGTPKAFRFAYDVVYTNRMSAGAYRGYGATQGIFAVESAITDGGDAGRILLRGGRERAGEHRPAEALLGADRAGQPLRAGVHPAVGRGVAAGADRVSLRGAGVGAAGRRGMHVLDQAAHRPLPAGQKLGGPSAAGLGDGGGLCAAALCQAGGDCGAAGAAAGVCAGGVLFDVHRLPAAAGDRFLAVHPEQPAQKRGARRLSSAKRCIIMEKEKPVKEESECRLKRELLER